MKMTPLYVLLAGALMLAVAPGVAAQSASVSVSGQCYDEDGSGGHDHLAANSEGEVTVLTVTGTVGALEALTDDPEAASNGNGCSEDYQDPDTPGEEEDQDHLSVTVTVDGETLQVCYDSELRTDGSCPSEPAGPPSDS